MIKYYFENIKLITNRTNRFNLYLLIFFLIISSFIELLGIGLIPILILSIQDPSEIFFYLSLYSLDFQFLNYNNINLFLALSLITIFLGKNIFLSFLLFFEYKVLLSISVYLNKKLYYNYINLNYLNFSKLNPSRIHTNLIGETKRTISLIGTLIKFIKEFVVALLIFITALIFSPISIITSILFLSIGSLVYYFFFKSKLSQTSSIYNEYLDRSIKNINEFIASFREIKNYRNEMFFTNLYEKQIYKRDNAQFTQNFIMQLPRLYLEVLIVTLIFIIMIIFTYLSNNNNIFVTFSFLVVALLRFYPAFNIILSSLAKIKSNKLAFDIIIEQIKNFQPNYHENRNIIKNKVDFHSLVINNISFEYDKKNYIFKDVNLTIKKGNKIGLIGKSGSGKSSLLDVIAGFQIPNKGKIIINNNLDSNNNNWQNYFSYVSQSTFLFDDTIKNNITFKEIPDSIDESRLKDVIKIACLDEFVSELKNGLDTLVGHNAIKLSGGQKQRIAIARSLYASKPILILDEATNALDSQTEQRLLNNLIKIQNELTLIIVSHRINSLKSCDKVYKIENKKIVEIINV